MSTEKTTVIIESPFRGDQNQNEEYAKAALIDCLRRGEAPFASHLLYTQVLREDNIEERKLGIYAGLEFGRLCQKTVVYTDLGITSGMRLGILAARKHGRPIEYRSIPGFKQGKTRSSQEEHQLIFEG